jgi:parallel beta-helix repeat protein
MSSTKLVLIFVTVLFASSIAPLLHISAQEPLTVAAITINADGTVSPPEAPVQQNGSIYTLTSDISTSLCGIMVLKSDSVIVGNGFTIFGNKNETLDIFAGVFLFSVNNVTVANFSIAGFDMGVLLFNSSGCIITTNHFANNTCHIVLQGSSGNTVNGNNGDNFKPGSLPACGVLAFAWSSNNIVRDNAFYNGMIGIAFLYASDSNHIVNNSIFNFTAGVFIEQSAQASIVENNIALSQFGVMLQNCSNDETVISWNNISYSQLSGIYVNYTSNTVIRNNNIANGTYGISLEYSSSVSVVHNNFFNNIVHAFNNASTAVWDLGYPRGGNYWSDWNDTDVYRGTFQNETGSDGILDHPYIIGEADVDHYPLAESLSTENCTLTIMATVGGSTFPAPGTYVYDVRSDVTVTATPNEGYNFGYWLLDGEETHENPLNLLMCSDHVLEAFFADLTAPNITIVTQNPPEDAVTPSDIVTVNASVVDLGSGLKQVILSYSDGGPWTTVNMTHVDGNKWTAMIPTFPEDTNVTYTITAEDNAGNIITSENQGYKLGYQVIPEFTLPALLTLFATFTGLTAGLSKRIKKSHYKTKSGKHVFKF